MTSSGNVVVGTVDVLGAWAQLLLGETVEGLPDQSEVRVQMAVTLESAYRSQESRVPVGRHEIGSGGEPVGGGAPGRLAPKVAAARSQSTSATNTQAMSASVSPCWAYSTADSAVCTPAAACARS